MTDDGASPRELLMEACRRNNTSLLEEVLADLAAAGGEKAAEHVAKVLNEARDGIGNGLLHMAASNGSYEVLDVLLDQEGLEIDEFDRLEKDTPLHKAVRYVNSLNPDEWEAGHHIVDILVDAGCDPRIRNKAKLRPFDLVDPRNQDLRKMLQQAEFTMMAGADIVQEDEEDGAAGSGSESD
ncbi:ankyrin repeat protein-like protein [Phyllosticta citricarpa]|uniref:Ankyrin repeat protein-like protein n=2 Tax=Phyllosticta TaxID=121621 RepID=A0ABR1MEI5_9PEZI